MDIVDDVVGYLRALLLYMGFDVNNLGQIFEPLPSRRNNIRHRSLVRRIGSRLPLLPARRIHVQSILLGSQGTRERNNESFCSEFSYVSSGGENLMWVEEDLGNNCIMVRPRTKHLDDLNEPAGISPSFHIDDLDDGAFHPILRAETVRSSTPYDVSACSMSALSTTDPFTQQKIHALEDELAALRSQIANLIKDQEKTRQPPIPFPDVCASGPLPAPMGPPPACPPPRPPPPPPPPPPPSTGGIFKAPTPGLSLADMIKQNKDMLSSAGTGSADSKTSGPLSMTDVLKGLGTVKLKAIQRSPGGTPLKTSKPKLAEQYDPASLITEALKKKFASRMLHSPRSPDTDKENDYDSPDSPRAPFGQHVLKKTKKRSLLFHERRNSASPLSERNQ
ncbi:mitochondrial fission regulator 2-like [Dreissena polymorpha]|uniref:Mitochondrial fission regulator 2 n=1 Tax=Dreissena polymorpha TaxID=45954 RepID=A0A9D4CXC3_DREPO|nr:mitochondrial fission regulator 2-like [Dreissena polymorpha]XP_052239451.1 mitochondrial fission regulator 2-like [Dreissena polymorpha]KAH3733608.1 hypothetical protein DPMN_040040 [Dreissena polymorpha]